MLACRPLVDIAALLEVIAAALLDTLAGRLLVNIAAVFEMTAAGPTEELAVRSLDDEPK